jgi:hypothetical protein
LQVLEAVDGDTRGTGRELQQSGLRAREDQHRTKGVEEG